MAGHITKRGNAWRIVLEVGVGPDGKRLRQATTFHGTKKAAQAELARLQHELNTGAFVEPSRLTVGQFLEKWLSAKGTLSTKTREHYAEFVHKHFVPALGALPLAKLSPMHIQSYYAEKLASGRRDGRGGLSAQSVLLQHRVLRQALEQAVKWQLLFRNPTDGVEPPRPGEKEMGVLTVAQTAQLLEAADGTRLYLPIMIAVATGMRRGEVLGLRWRDLDLDGRLVFIRQAIQRTEGGIEFKQPKTQKSRRSVKLPPVLIEELRRHRATQAAERELLGKGYQDHDLVIAQADGTPFPPNAFTHAFTALMAKTGLPRIRFHDLRHGHATHLLLMGTNVKVVSERLGHSNVNITLNIYSHVLPEMQEEAAQRMDAALRAAMGDPGTDEES
jgi:integrase